MESKNSNHYADNMAALIEMEKTIDKINSNLLSLSIKHERTKIAMTRATEENKRLSAVTTIMSGYIKDSLDLFENLFESNESFCDVARMKEYVVMARYMGDYFGRPHIADRVEAKANQLPF